MPIPPQQRRRRDDSLERARVRMVYVVGFLIVLDAIVGIFRIEPDIDLGVFATLMGGELALLGLGAVIRLTGR